METARQFRGGSWRGGESVWLKDKPPFSGVCFCIRFLPKRCRDFSFKIGEVIIMSTKETHGMVNIQHFCKVENA